MSKIPPLSLLPIELATLFFSAYRLVVSDLWVEKVASFASLILHTIRFMKHKDLIFKFSKKEWIKSCLISITMIFVIYSIFYSSSSIIPIIVIAGICQILGYYFFAKSSGINFKWFDMSIDIPIMLLSSSIFYILYSRGDRFCVMWGSDVIYHIMEIIIQF